MNTLFDQKPDRLLRRKEVEQRTGLKRSSIYAYMKQGRFPPCIKMGPKAVGWRESEIDAFVESRKRQRDANVHILAKSGSFKAHQS